MLHVCRRCGVAAIVLAASATVAQAQPAPAAAPSAGPPPAGAVGSLEVTPHVSFAGDEASGVGASLGFRIRPTMLVELDAEARLTNPERFQRVYANLVWELRRVGAATPYVVVGAGYDAYRGEYVLPTIGVFGWSSSGVGANVGGGVRVPLGERWALRTDLRWTVGASQGLPNRIRAFHGLTRAIGSR